MLAEQEKTVAPSDAEMFAEVCACVRSLVETLKPEYASAIRRVGLEGVPVRRFAEEQKISANNAAVRLHRAHQALRNKAEQK
jgi:RNA polymerase sigma-70 factor (ECF subfamily)